DAVRRVQSPHPTTVMQPRGFRSLGPNVGLLAVQLLEQSHGVVLVALLGNEPVEVHAEEPSKPKFDPTPRRRDWISSEKLGRACGGARAHELSSHKTTICRDVHNLGLKVGHGFPELLVGFAISVEAPDTGQQMCTYLFPYTRKLFSPVTGLYSPSCRALIPFSHVSF